METGVNPGILAGSALGESLKEKIGSATIIGNVLIHICDNFMNPWVKAGWETCSV